jgi:hypothetical protein
MWDTERPNQNTRQRFVVIIISLPESLLSLNPTPYREKSSPFQHTHPLSSKQRPVHIFNQPAHDAYLLPPPALRLLFPLLSIRSISEPPSQLLFSAPHARAPFPSPPFTSQHSYGTASCNFSPSPAGFSGTPSLVGLAPFDLCT